MEVAEATRRNWSEQLYTSTGHGGPAMPDQPIGQRSFTDGTVREVYADPDGRQYVLVQGERVYGTWLMPEECDEPVIVSGAS